MEWNYMINSHSIVIINLFVFLLEVLFVRNSLPDPLYEVWHLKSITFRVSVYEPLYLLFLCHEV